jgi:hypothetical protein
MRCQSLSSDRVVEVIREFYTPLALNVTKDPEFQCAQDLPALKHVANIYRTNWRFEFGFASCVMVTANGEHVLGWMGGTKDERTFLETMVTALERDRKLSQAKAKLARGDMSGIADMGAVLGGLLGEIAQRQGEALQESARMFQGLAK